MPYFPVFIKISLLVLLTNSCELIPLNAFSSFTAYRNSNLKGLENTSKHLKTCDLVHQNVVFRHGTSFPKESYIDAMTLLHKKILKSLYTSTLPLSFLNWKNSFREVDEKLITDVGIKEMQYLAQRFRPKMGHMAALQDNTKYVKISSSSHYSSQKSALIFLKYYLNNKYSDDVISSMNVINDKEIKFYEGCPNYVRDQIKNSEDIMFLNGPEIKEAIKNLKSKWKLNDVNITPDDLVTLYVMCAFAIATNISCEETADSNRCDQSPPPYTKDSSPLCLLFDPEHYTLLEYYFDLKYYWANSHGNKIVSLLPCGMMDPILEEIHTAAMLYHFKEGGVKDIEFQNFLKKNNYIISSFRFGHLKTLLGMANILNIFNEQPEMTADRYKQRLSFINDERKRFKTFRVSNISPFSGSIALELYHCTKDGDGNFR